MAEPDLKGRLTSFSFSDIIQLLSFSRQTGTLTLSQGWNSRTITFEAGRISYIASGTKLLGVGELLLRAGKITAEQLEGALLAMPREAKPLARILIEMGVVTEADLKQVREQQIDEIVYSLFLWRRCEFSFQSGLITKVDGIPVDLNGERLIMEGTRRVDEWISIAHVVPSVRVAFRRRSTPSSEPLEAAEMRVLEIVDGRRDVVNIARNAGLTQFDTAKALYSLTKKGYAAPISPDKGKIIELFHHLCESMYLKLMMFGHSKVASEFENQFNKFATDHNLKVRMRAGKMIGSDAEVRIDTTALIDLYRLFIATENNKFSKIFPPDIVKGLVEGLYRNLDKQFQDMMVMYEFIAIDHLALSARENNARQEARQEVSRRVSAAPTAPLKALSA